MKTSQINFNKGKGLLPVIIQEEKTGKILMLGFMNKDAYQKTLESGFVWFWSRSRGALWQKGETSGNKLQVTSIVTDCDQDVLLIKVILWGDTCCHTGAYSCFGRLIVKKKKGCNDMLPER